MAESQQGGNIFQDSIDPKTGAFQIFSLFMPERRARNAKMRKLMEDERQQDFEIKQAQLALGLSELPTDVQRVLGGQKFAEGAGAKLQEVGSQSGALGLDEALGMVPKTLQAAAGAGNTNAGVLAPKLVEDRVSREDGARRGFVESGANEGLANVLDRQSIQTAAANAVASQVAGKERAATDAARSRHRIAEIVARGEAKGKSGKATERRKAVNSEYMANIHRLKNATFQTGEVNPRTGEPLTEKRNLKTHPITDAERATALEDARATFRGSRGKPAKGGPTERQKLRNMRSVIRGRHGLDAQNPGTIDQIRRSAESARIAEKLFKEQAVQPHLAVIAGIAESSSLAEALPLDRYRGDTGRTARQLNQALEYVSEMMEAGLLEENIDLAELVNQVMDEIGVPAGQAVRREIMLRLMQEE